MAQGNTTSPAQRGLDDLLMKMAELKASDLFLQPHKGPVFRVNGRIVRTADAPTTPEQMAAYVDHLLTPVAREKFTASPDMDLAYTVAGRGRFRINLFLHQGQTGLAARLIPADAVQFRNLNLPDGIREMAEARTGMILVVGPTGCGKSTTLAALVNHINATREDHIITIEDPIEFVHDEIKSLIHQRQVGYDTVSFATALRHVVRQNPDTILIGEMRDADTMQTALSAALTGHLILSTLHTTNAVQSVDRILNYFPPEARRQAQIDLAATLVGIVCMRLLPRADGRGRVPAVEVLRGTPLVKKLIAEGKLVELYDVMKRGNESGMCTLNQSLVDLCSRKLVSEKDALPVAPNPEEFRLNMQGMFTGIDSIDLRTTHKDEKKKWNE